MRVDGIALPSSDEGALGTTDNFPAKHGRESSSHVDSTAENLPIQTLALPAIEQAAVAAVQATMSAIAEGTAQTAIKLTVAYLKAAVGAGARPQEAALLYLLGADAITTLPPETRNNPKIVR